MVNKVILIGNLGSDPEVRYTQNGSAVASFNLATSEKYKKDGEWVEQTEWHRLVFFGRTAEICGEYLTKGKRIYVEGKLQTRKWEDRDGNTKYTTEVVGREMKMLSAGSNDRANSPEAGGDEGPPDMGDDVPF